MGWTYNLAKGDAPTMDPTIAIAAVIFSALSMLAIALRAYVRYYSIRAAETKWGLGLENYQDMPTEDIYTFGLIQYIGALFYIVSILGFKLSLLFSYLRFITQGRYRQLCIAVIAGCVMSHIAFLLVQLNLCQPVRRQWDPAVTEGTCIPAVPFYTAMASITILFDILVMLLPFPILLNSQIQNRKKAVLLGLFTLGIFITIIQMTRIQTVRRLISYTDSSNPGITVTCIPTLSPLFKYFGDRTGTQNDTKRGRDINSHYAMRTWNGTCIEGHPLDSRDDKDAETSSLEGRVAVVKAGSSEFILGHGITKKIEIVVTTA